MPSLQDLQAKRGALMANLEQLIGQVNRVNGAVAVVDELIAEENAAQEAEAAAAADPMFGPVVDIGGINRDPSPMWETPAALAAAPEMLPILPDAEAGDAA